MERIDKNISVDVGALLTPEDLAVLFCSLDSEEMAAFFNKVGEVSSKWEGSLSFQLYNAVLDMNEQGRRVINAIQSI